jgi:geranylgeranyl pyrophosphate synthase
MVGQGWRSITQRVAAPNWVGRVEQSILDIESDTQVTTDSAAPKKTSKRRKTAHLKLVPPTKELRVQLRDRCRKLAETLDKDRPLTKDEMEGLARQLLGELNLPEGYVGWTMVALSSEFWRDQVAAVPHSRRLFLLPHCLKHAEGCPADYDKFGLDCKTCGACSIADFRTTAEEMGYKVLVAEGSPIVLKIIVSGYVDAIVGVACLNVLEKAIDKILLAGIPCMAVPLLSSDCRNTSVDEDWVAEMIRVPHTEKRSTTRSFVHLLRGAHQLFDDDELERLSPRQRGDIRLREPTRAEIQQIDPVLGTEAIAYEFLSRGGKHLRPFVTLAIYDAMTGGQATCESGPSVIRGWPDHVKRSALSIETFHKASLVHDDIEDADEFRYGRPSLHKTFGIPTAINVGDYLIGLGYRLVSRDAGAMGSDCAADILDLLADAHQRLSEGQGAELLWRDAPDKRISPVDALRIYGLKTAPAFEAALLTGARLAGPLNGIDEPLRKLSRDLGIGFQILNDLKDWQVDGDNKLSKGLDLLAGRPTVLWALAGEGLSDGARTELNRLVATSDLAPEFRIERAGQLYADAEVFDKAHRLVDKYRDRAVQTVKDLDPAPLRQLLTYLIELVLDQHEDVQPTIQFVEPTSLVQPLPVAAS